MQRGKQQLLEGVRGDADFGRGLAAKRESWSPACGTDPAAVSSQPLFSLRPALATHRPVLCPATAEAGPSWPPPWLKGKAGPLSAEK